MMLTGEQTIIQPIRTTARPSVLVCPICDNGLTQPTRTEIGIREFPSGHGSITTVEPVAADDEIRADVQTQNVGAGAIDGDGAIKINFHCEHCHIDGLIPDDELENIVLSLVQRDGSTVAHWEVTPRGSEPPPAPALATNGSAPAQHPRTIMRRAETLIESLVDDLRAAGAITDENEKYTPRVIDEMMEGLDELRVMISDTTRFNILRE